MINVRPFVFIAAINIKGQIFIIYISQMRHSHEQMSFFLRATPYTFSRVNWGKGPARFVYGSCESSFGRCKTLEDMPGHDVGYNVYCIILYNLYTYWGLPKPCFIVGVGNLFIFVDGIPIDLHYPPGFPVFRQDPVLFVILSTYIYIYTPGTLNNQF